MTYYVITAIDYEDYHILGVTVNKKAAEKFVKEYNTKREFNFASIEQYDELTEYVEQKG